MNNDEKNNLKIELIEVLSPMISSTIEKRLDDIPVHKMSPETERRLHSIEECIKQKTEQDTIVATQVKEMHEVFTSTRFMLKFSLKLFAVIGLISGACIGVIRLFKEIK